MTDPSPLLAATLAVDTWGIPGGLFLVGYVVLVVAAIALVLWAPGRLDRTAGDAVDDLRAVDLAFLHDGDRLAVTSALASLRTAELLDDDARPTPAGHLGAGEPGDRVQAALLGVLRRARDNAPARRLSTLMAHPEVFQAVRDVEAGLRERGLLRTTAEHATARRWALVAWAVAALGVARVVASVVADEPYGWMLLFTGLALIVAAGTSIGGAVTPNRRAAATLDRARATHRDLRTATRPTAPDFRRVDVGLAVALFGWTVMTGAMRPVARAVDLTEVFDPNVGETSVAG